MNVCVGKKWFRMGLVARTSLALLTVGVLGIPSVSAQDKKDKKEAVPQLTARCDRADAMYRVGDNAKFIVTGTNAGEADYRLSDDGAGTISQGKIQIKPGEGHSITGTLGKPGFLQLVVQQGKTRTLAAAAFDPTKIEPTATMPADFDSFWAAAKKELAAVPMDAQVVKSEKDSSERVTCYMVSLANVGGKRVHGWLSVPKGTGPFPAILTVPGAGVAGISPDKHHAFLGALSMNIIIHDLPVDQSKAFYRKEATGPLKNYWDIGMDDKDKSYYRAVILGCVRCLDYLTSGSDYNGKDLAVTGGSQGGALTLITSGLDPRVKLAAPNVAAMCDHSGKAFGRVSGWPHWLDNTPKDKADKVLEASAYYDAVNFARKFQGNSLHGVGFIDTTCAPTTVYAAFNVHPEPKTMIASPLMGHGTDPRWLKARDEFWKKNMKLVAPER
jgi:cephalosporin-C deacetylase